MQEMQPLFLMKEAIERHLILPSMCPPRASHLHSLSNAPRASAPSAIPSGELPIRRTLICEPCFLLPRRQLRQPHTPSAMRPARAPHLQCTAVSFRQQNQPPSTPITSDRKLTAYPCQQKRQATSLQPPALILLQHLDFLLHLHRNPELPRHLIIALLTQIKMVNLPILLRKEIPCMIRRKHAFPHDPIPHCQLPSAPVADHALQPTVFSVFSHISLFLRLHHPRFPRSPLQYSGKNHDFKWESMEPAVST